MLTKRGVSLGLDQESARRLPFWRSTLVFLAMLMAVTFGASTAAQADNFPQYQVVGTGGIGVAYRSVPWGPGEGYGAPEGAWLTLYCYYPYGDPVGSNGNRVWWNISYGNRGFWVADHWLSTPAPVNGRPTIGLSQCQ
ncbi:hypothetical protein [Fodinicola acaciae]|uniref:hypothetical protein n=1 Tax=Fodinicola acaciae TaxID=2681555 RepID=UPI0013D326F6|nr:hypothetical protein [Fodinicola acaciae]